MKKRFIFGIVIIIVSVLLFAKTKQPSLDKNWEAGMEILPEVSIENNIVTFNNFRDWRYNLNKETTSFNYISRTYNADNIERVWFVMEPFMLADQVTHTYLAFDFTDQEPAILSIEARREKGEKFTILKGFINEMELMYIWGTEKDITGRRVLVEQNNVYMYPLDISKEGAKKYFLSIAKETKKLQDNPKFYNIITNNCTNLLAVHANDAEVSKVPLHGTWIFPGFAENILYKFGYIKNELPLGQIKSQNNVTQLIRDNYDREDFSNVIRESLYK